MGFARSKLNPPPVGWYMVIKYQLLSGVIHFYIVLCKCRLVVGRIFIPPAGHSFQKIPYHLCCQVAGCSRFVRKRINLEQPESFQPVADAGIMGNTACFFAEQPIGRCPGCPGASACLTADISKLRKPVLRKTGSTAGKSSRNWPRVI